MKKLKGCFTILFSLVILVCCWYLFGFIYSIRHSNILPRAMQEGVNLYARQVPSECTFGYIEGNRVYAPNFEYSCYILTATHYEVLKAFPTLEGRFSDSALAIHFSPEINNQTSTVIVIFEEKTYFLNRLALGRILIHELQHREDANLQLTELERETRAWNLHTDLFLSSLSEFDKIILEFGGCPLGSLREECDLGRYKMLSDSMRYERYLVDLYGFYE